MTLVSATNKGGYKQELDRTAYTTKRVWYSLQRMGSINCLELYRSAYTTKRLWYRLQWGGYTLEHYRYVYITKRLSYHLQRRRFINYLELYKSAYTTKRLGYRLLTIVVINKSYTTKRLWYRHHQIQQWRGYTLELIDMSISLKDFRIAYKEGGYELFRAL